MRLTSGGFGRTVRCSALCCCSATLGCRGAAGRRNCPLRGLSGACSADRLSETLTPSGLCIPCRLAGHPRTNARRVPYLTRIGHTGIAVTERLIRFRCRVVPAADPAVMMHLVIASVRTLRVTEGAPVVMMMESVAVMPVPVMCPAVMNVPPSRIIAPVPR